MKKIFKYLTVFLLAVVASVACILVVGCKNNGDNGGNTSEPDYIFVLRYANGTKVNGQTGNTSGGKVQTQICLPGDTCRPLFAKNIYPDEQGKLTLTQAQVNDIFKSSTDITVFDFHALNVKDAITNDVDIRVEHKGTYTLVVDAAKL